MRVVAVALLVSFALSGCSSESHTPTASSPISNSTSGIIHYYGGPVLSHVQLEIVYWGDGVSVVLQDDLASFYRALVNSTYMDQLAEYTTNTQTIGRGSVDQAVTIRPFNSSMRLTQSDIEQELEEQFEAGALPRPTPDTLYMVHFPGGFQIHISFGNSCTEWFADHEVYQSRKFGSVFYALMPCDSGDASNLSLLSEGVSHEVAEAVTDPNSPLAGQAIAYPAAWMSSSGEEIGDLCTGLGASLVSGATSYTVQRLWLDSLGACSGANVFSTSTAIKQP